MPATMTHDVAAIRRGVEETSRRFEQAFAGGDVASVMREVYSADARVLPPDAEMVRGRDNVAQFWAAAKQQLGIQRVELQIVELQPAGDQAFEIGLAKLTLGGGQKATAKYVVIWKQEDGRWKLHVDIWNMSPG